MNEVTHKILTTLFGSCKSHEVNLWSEGGGVQLPGIVTSLSQLHAEIITHLTSVPVDLYYVTKLGRTQEIQNNEELKAAVRRLHNQGILSVTAIEEDQSSHPGALDHLCTPVSNKRKCPPLYSLEEPCP